LTTLPRRMRTRLVSVGIRPEHVQTPDVFQVSSFRSVLSAAVPARQDEK